MSFALLLVFRSHNSQTLLATTSLDFMFRNQMSTFEDQNHCRVSLQIHVRSVHSALIMDAIRAFSEAGHRAVLPVQGHAFHASRPTKLYETVAIVAPKTLFKRNTAIRNHPKQPSYEVFPPEIWLLILRECPTSSLKNLAQVDKPLHALASDQLLRTVVLGQGTLGHCVLDKTLDNATVIKDPAAFSALVLNHKQLRWYKVTKAVFVVYRTSTFVVRLSALPLVCYYITQIFAPEDLDKYKWTVWIPNEKKKVVTLWPLDMWTVKHPIMRTVDTSRYPLLGDPLVQDY
jgi:hypothetical protein